MKSSILILAAGLAIAQQTTPPAGRGGFGNAGFVPNPAYDKEPPQLPDGMKPGAVLIFSKTSGYRDEPAMQASNAALAAIAHERGWPFFVTENGAVMNDQQLSRFKVVVWNNTSGDTLNDEQKTAFKSWMEKGGSFVGIHGAGGDPVGNYGHSSAAEWKWLVDTLIGAQFTVHSSVTPGEIHVEDPKSPLMKNLPALWKRSEEWYAFSESPRTKPGFHIVATVDEKTYNPGSRHYGRRSSADLVALRGEGSCRLFGAGTRRPHVRRATDDPTAGQYDRLGSDGKRPRLH